jgi:L,D-transpeptidase-like protein
MGLMCRRAGVRRLAFILLSTGYLGAPRFVPGGDADLLSSSAQPASLRGSRGAELSLTLNLPSFRLEVHRGRALLRTFRVAIGMRTFQTPRGSFAITQVEWNPWWIPPDEAWARHEHVTPPGGANPMGKVKLYFRPLYFLHGTPFGSSIGSAASHGCVRMRNQDAIDLALLLQGPDSPAAAAERLRPLLVDYSVTRMFAVAQPVPLQITYQVAEVRADSLFLYADVYRLGPATVHDALVAMSAKGVDTSAVERDALASAVHDARRATVAVSLQSLKTH